MDEVDQVRRMAAALAGKAEKGSAAELESALEKISQIAKVAPIDLRHEITTKCDLVIEALAD